MSSKLIVNSIENTTGTHTINLDSGNSSIVGDLTVGGNLDLSSGGVYLGGSGSANLLDDYEEGTWTPALEQTTGIVHDVQSGVYTKAGRLVTVSFVVGTSSANSSINAILINGLPYAPSNQSLNETAYSGTFEAIYLSLVSGSQYNISIASSGNKIQLRRFSSGGGNSGALWSDVTNYGAFEIRGSLTYLTS